MSAILRCQRCRQEWLAQRSDAKYCPTCKPFLRREIYQKYERGQKKACSVCGSPTGRRSQLCLSCENKRRTRVYAGSNNPNWKQGRSHKADGYVYIRVKTGSPGVGKGSYYRGEHIVVWERVNGPLQAGWVVHHFNGIKDDNRLENLVAMPRKQHSPNQVVEPYQARIRELERQLAEKT